MAAGAGITLIGACAFWLGLTGCSSAPQPYSRGQAIPLGLHAVTVTYVEMKQFQRIDSLAVHLSISGIGSPKELEAAMARFMGRLVVRDSTGRKTLGLLMLAKHFEIASLDPRDFSSSYGSSYAGSRMLEDAMLSGADPTRWVALFAVPAQAQGFTLLIANPDRKEGQASSVSVELSR